MAATLNSTVGDVFKDRPNTLEVTEEMRCLISDIIKELLMESMDD